MYPGLSKLQKNQACDFSKVPCKFCPIYQSTNFYFDPLSKVFMNFSRANENSGSIHFWLCQWFWTLFFPNFTQVMDMPAVWLVNCLLGYCLPFSAPLCHISDRAGSHQKFTWHWAFCSIPKRITSSTHLATVISVEAKKMKSYCPPPSPPDFSKNHYCSNANTAVAGGEGGGQEKAKNGYFKMPIFLRGSGKPLYFKENDSNKSPRRR